MIFHSYVSLPEGTYRIWWNPKSTKLAPESHPNHPAGTRASLGSNLVDLVCTCRRCSTGRFPKMVPKFDGRSSLFLQENGGIFCISKYVLRTIWNVPSFGRVYHHFLHDNFVISGCSNFSDEAISCGVCCWPTQPCHGHKWSRPDKACDAFCTNDGMGVANKGVEALRLTETIKYVEFIYIYNVVL